MPQVGLPRRFGIGAVLALTALFAIVFSLLRALGGDGFAFGVVGVFFVIVGVSQCFLYGGRNPRRASVMAGLWVGGLIGFAMFGLAAYSDWHAPTLGDTLCLGAILCLNCLGFGAIMGYCVGCLIAGVFLLTEKKQPSSEATETESTTDTETTTTE